MSSQEPGASKNFPPHTALSNQRLTGPFIRFCEKIGAARDIKSFLLILKASVPKKLKTGELALFYKSHSAGLRRAYIRNSVFCEEEAKSPWPKTPQIGLCSPEQNLYLAEEFGRPFSKSLMIPLYEPDLSASAMLFAEMGQWGRLLEELKTFFEERELILKLSFKRVFLKAGFSRVSYLWSQLFAHWQEPLAILQNFKALRLNEAFKELASSAPCFLEEQKLSGWAEAKGNIYKIHYYPIERPESPGAGILYCQDMTKPLHLKEQLFQSEKMSELCKLGRNMAQRLNSPLREVQSMAQILRQNPRMEKFKEDLAELEKAARRSQKIIESLLSFSQIHGEKKTCRLNQAVESSLPLLKSAANGLRVELELFPQPLEVQGDPSILQQVAYNLILNACQALKEDKYNKNPRILISSGMAPQNKAFLKVKDNGPGIAKRHLEKIFQPLWTSKKKGKGTGLGLGMAKKFIRRFGGDIFVSSKEGESACFSVLLPLSRPNEDY